MRTKRSALLLSLPFLHFLFDNGEIEVGGEAEIKKD